MENIPDESDEINDTAMDLLPSIIQKRFDDSVSITTKGTPIEKTYRTRWIWSILGEMSLNYIEHFDRGGRKGGHDNIHITFGNDEITLTDDLVNDNPQEIIESIQNIKDSNMHGTTKPDTEGGINIKGTGIFRSMMDLKESGGDLQYSVVDGHIVTKILLGDWKNHPDYSD